MTKSSHNICMQVCTQLKWEWCRVWKHTKNGVAPGYSLVTLAPGATPPSPGATPTPAVAPSLLTTGARVTVRADEETNKYCIKQHNYQSTCNIQCIFNRNSLSQEKFIYG